MIFISYINRDEQFADFLAEKLISLGLQVFRMPIAVGAGELWMESLRSALNSCDEAIGLLSYRAYERPWIPAEWAAFWVRGKRYTPLLIGIEPNDLWDPMRAAQAVHASNTSQVEALLARLMRNELTTYDPAVIRAARMISDHESVRSGAGDQALERIRGNLPMGTDNVDPDDVALVVDLGKLPELMEIIAVPSQMAGNVKLKQIALVLAAKRQLVEALRTIELCSNRNERLNAVRPFLAELGASVAPDDRRFIASVVALLGPPQLRTLIDLLRANGIDPDAIGIDPGATGGA